MSFLVPLVRGHLLAVPRPCVVIQRRMCAVLAGDVCMLEAARPLVLEARPLVLEVQPLVLE